MFYQTAPPQDPMFNSLAAGSHNSSMCSQAKCWRARTPTTQKNILVTYSNWYVNTVSSAKFCKEAIDLVLAVTVAFYNQPPRMFFKWAKCLISSTSAWLVKILFHLAGFGQTKTRLKLYLLLRMLPMQE